MKVIIVRGPIKEMTTSASIGFGPDMALGQKSSAVAANRREYGKRRFRRGRKKRLDR